MKNYSAKSLVAIAISICLLTSCKKDVPGFEKAKTNTAINNASATNNADMIQMAKPPIKGGLGMGNQADTSKIK